MYKVRVLIFTERYSLYNMGSENSWTNNICRWTMYH